jgi:hypothetical protein
MRQRFHILFIIILSILSHSCYVYEEVILPELPPQLAVSGLAVYGDINTLPNSSGENNLYISSIRSYADESEDTIKQGPIIFSGPIGRDPIPPLPFQSPFVYSYELDIDWQPESVYELEVKFPDFPEVSCQFEVPVQVQRIEASIKDSILVNGDLLTAFEFTIYDPQPGIKNFFSLDIMAQHTDRGSGQRSINQIGWFHQNPLMNTQSGYISDENFIDGKYSFKQEIDLSYLPFEPSFWQDWIFEVRSINQETFEYLEVLERHARAQENDLFATPSPVKGNIEGGEGFFGVIAVSQDTIPWHK